LGEGHIKIFKLLPIIKTFNSIQVVRMSQKDFDVIFIGGGGASYPGAFELAKAGKKVLMIDNKGNLGGDCLYAGCIPSKTVRTKILEFTSANKEIDPEKVWNEVVKLKEYVQDIRYQQHMEEIREHGPNLTFVKGWATILSSNKVKVEGEENFEANTKYLVIGTGAEHIILNIPGKDMVITSDDLFAYQKTMKKVPKSIAIIGGGYIGVEVADMLSRLGVEVSIIEMMDRLLPTMPLDLSKAAESHMKEAKVNLYLNSPVASIEKKGDKKIVKANSKSGVIEVEADEVLMAVGRKPRLKGYGLENLEKDGLKIERNAIWVSPSLRTSLFNVFATGDVTGKAMLFHAAVKESIIAAKNILIGRDAYRMNYHSVPFTVFTYPEIGLIGYTEEELKSLGIPYDVVDYKLAGDAQSQITNHREGWMKIFLEKETLRILGVQVYSHDAAELMGAFAVALENGLTAKNLAWVCGPHPLTFESINYAMRSYF
jgi:dihydrolipoamide dehydrogenase